LSKEGVIEPVKETIKSYHLISPHEHVLVACSGGSDSTALFYILAKLRHELKFSISTLYLNHGLRQKEAAQELEVVRRFSQRLNVPFYTQNLPVQEYARKEKKSIELAARILRYRAFEELASKIKADRVAVGHTQDDNLETILLNFLRGGGLAALKGIPIQRGKVIRPLLEIPRRALQKYLSQRKLSYCQDSSNAELNFKRNKLRHLLIPFLEKEFNPALREVLTRNAKILKEENDFLEKETTKFFTQVCSLCQPEKIAIDLNKFISYSPFIKKRIILRCLKELSFGDEASFDRIQEIFSFIHEKPPDKIWEARGKFWVEKTLDKIIFQKGTRSGKKWLGREKLEIPGQTEIPALKVKIESKILKKRRPFTKEYLQLQLDKLSLPLYLRTRREGDRFQPVGLLKEKKLKDFFNTRGIPRAERDTKLLVVDSGDEILGVIGEDVSEKAKVSQERTSILQITLKKN
jgi:tRNA(Ile)-lysidine synthase